MNTLRCDAWTLRLSLCAATALTLFSPSGTLAADSPWGLQSLATDSHQLKLSGSFRTRYESLDGQPRVGFEDSPDVLSFRTTLFAEYAFGAFRIGGELYDSRAYWAGPNSGVGANEVNALEPVQAYVVAEFDEPFGNDTNASLKAGRFTLNLGSRRLVAADDYRNTTNGYTGVRVDLNRKNTISSTLIYTLPQRHLPDDMPSILDNEVQLDSESSALVLWGGLVTFPQIIGDASLDASFFKLTEGDEPNLATRNRRLSTTSLRVFRDVAPETWDYEIEGAYQTGSIRTNTALDAPEIDVSAYFYHVELGYQRADAWQTHISVEYDEVSGDDGDADYGRFDTMFGMRRGDFAPSGIYAAVARANIRSPGIRIEVTPSKDLDAFIGYRALWLESRTDGFSTTGVRDTSGQSGDFAGHQLDMRARYWLIPDFLRLEGDVVLLFKGEFLKEAPSAPRTGDTRYFSLNLTATF
jgi:hypothetical protein